MSVERYFYRNEDAKRFEIEALLTNTVIIACFVGGVLSLAPFWFLALVINVALVRWMLAVHELFHIQKYEEANPFLRLFLIPFSPINAGYLEFRSLHMLHHRFTADENDPDAFHIRGGHWRSLMGAFFFPEGSTIAYFKRERRLEHVWEVVARLSFFVVFAIWGGIEFWSIWLILRINYALSIWIFFHHLHYRSGQYGTFSLPLSAFLRGYFGLVYGKPALLATMHHDVHHRFPRVAAIHLEKVAQSNVT